MIPGAEKQYLRTLQARGGWLSQKHGVDLQESAPCASNAQKVNVSLSWGKKVSKELRQPVSYEGRSFHMWLLRPTKTLPESDPSNVNTLLLLYYTSVHISHSLQIHLSSVSPVSYLDKNKISFFPAFPDPLPHSVQVSEAQRKTVSYWLLFFKKFFLKWTACTILCFTH